MSKKAKKARNTMRSKLSQQAFDRAQARANSDEAAGMKTKRDEAAWGTSSSALGLVKQQSEEAKLVQCPECGYSAGRHSGRCSHAEDH